MADPNLSSFIWSVADLLRGDYKQSEYGKVILPFTVLRRLDCVLESTKTAVLKEKEVRDKSGINPEPFLLKKSGQLFYNTSPLDLKKLMGDQDHIGENLRAYLQAFSPAVRDIFESFEFHTQIDKLAKSGLLYQVTEKFANIDLHPQFVSNAVNTAYSTTVTTAITAAIQLYRVVSTNAASASSISVGPILNARNRIR